VDLFDYRAPLGVRRILVLAVLDLYSRMPIALVAFPSPPTAAQVRSVLRRAFLQFGTPGHVVTDHGPPFPARRLTRFLKGHGVRRRYGAVARPQSVAAIDRWSQTIQSEYLTPWILLLPIRSLQRHLDFFAEYASRHRPHQGLGGRAPGEVHRGRKRRRVVALETVIGLERRAFDGDPRLPVYRLLLAA
jgi:transposase InsO family protein